MIKLTVSNDSPPSQGRCGSVRHPHAPHQHVPRLAFARNRFKTNLFLLKPFALCKKTLTLLRQTHAESPQWADGGLGA